MWNDYVDIPWASHGEQLPIINEEATHPSSPQLVMPNHDMADMLQDAFGFHDHMTMPSSPEVVGAENSNSSVDAQKFYKLLEDANTDLFLGARVKKLEFLVRLQRLYMSRHTADDMSWHSKIRTKDGVLRHLADSPAWAHLDEKYPDFGNECRNVRLGLASDGFSPFGMSRTTHSTWPVVMSVYNLPPWLCMKQPYLFLSLLILGPKGPGNNIDVYLQPLVEELKMLWNEGVETYDAFKKEMFRLRAAVLWTINDFPAYAMLSGYSTKGFKACPVCVEDIESVRLKNCKKLVFMGARRWLCDDHRYRGWKNNFNGKVERRPRPNGLTGSQCLRAIRGLIIKFGRRKKKKGTRKRKQNVQTLPEEDFGNWRKRSIFFELPYWEHLLLRHNLDVMHIEKNVTDSVLGTLLRLQGKNKDSKNARNDMVLLNVKHGLHPVTTEGNNDTIYPPASFNLLKDERTMMCEVMADYRPPDGWSSNIDCARRFLHTLKLYVRNKAQPEGCIAEGYIIDECLSFCTMYLSGDTESERIRLSRNADDPNNIVRPGLPLFVTKGRALEKGKKFMLTDEEKKRAHTHVLLNCPEIDSHLKYVWSYFVIGACGNRERRRGRRSVQESERQANLSFFKYFKSKIREKINEGDVNIDPDICALAEGPNNEAKRYKRYAMNGCRFHVKSVDTGSTYQNSGIFVQAGSNCYATANDRQPRDDMLDYYGVLTDIIELDYHNGRKVLLFEGNWIDSRTYSRGLKKDEFGFILSFHNHTKRNNDCCKRLRSPTQIPPPPLCRKLVKECPIADSDPTTTTVPEAGKGMSDRRLRSHHHRCAESRMSHYDMDFQLADDGLESLHDSVEYDDSETQDVGHLFVPQSTAPTENRSSEASRGNKKRGRGKTIGKWAVGRVREQVKWGMYGAPVWPRDKCAHYSHFLGSLATDGVYFPIDVQDWRHFDVDNDLGKAWLHIEGTIDWSEADTAAKKSKIKKYALERLSDRWKHHKADLKKLYWVPNKGTDELNSVHICENTNLREKHNFDELREEINRQTIQAQSDIEALKKQLEEAKIVRRHKEECEAIRRLIAMQPPRSQTLKIISDLEKEIAALDSENTASSRMLELRKKQFALLLHVVDELQTTIEEEQKSLIEEKEQRSVMEFANGGPEPMHVD
ncbi:PREDICTED: uncharacterized protein LOC101291426 [Fragaria vesca subsp. vesca]